MNPWIVRETPQLRAIVEEARALVRDGSDETEAAARLRAMAGGDTELLRRAITVAHGRDPVSATARHLLVRAVEHERTGFVLSADERALLAKPTEEAFAALVCAEPRLAELEAEALRAALPDGRPPSGLAGWVWRRLPAGEERPLVSEAAAVRLIAQKAQQLVGPRAMGKGGLLASDAALAVSTRHLSAIAGLPPRSSDEPGVGGS